LLANGTPSTAIYIGNSFFYYNNGMYSMVNKLAAAATPPIQLNGVMVTISGSDRLDDVESYFRPVPWELQLHALERIKFNEPAEAF